MRMGALNLLSRRGQVGRLFPSANTHGPAHMVAPIPVFHSQSDCSQAPALTLGHLRFRSA